MRPLPEFLKPLLDDCAIDGRKLLRAPFIRAGHLCLTNGRVLVRMPGEDWEVPAKIEHECKYPRVEDLIKPDMLMARFDDPPAPEIVVTTVDCTTCGGDRRVRYCKACEGEGVTRLMSKCPSCKGAGYVRVRTKKDTAVECPTCSIDGKLRSYAPSCFKLPCGTWLDSGMWTLIRDLPGLKISKRSKSHKGWVHKPFIFIFDGGHGLFMPLTGPWRDCEEAAP